MFRIPAKRLFTYTLVLTIGTAGLGITGGGTTPSASAQKLQARPLAPTGSGFTYQGRLNNGGTAANGQFDLNFVLWDAASGGTQVGSIVSIVNQAVSNGLFTVNLDFGSPAFQGSARWLEIAVRPAGAGSYTTLAPRQPLTPAPYAMSLMPGAVVTGTLGGPLLMLTNNGNGPAVQGSSSTNTGGYFTSTSFIGAWGQSTSNIGVQGQSSTSDGVYGVSDTGVGVYGLSSNGSGVYGQGINGNGVYGITSDANSAGLYGTHYGNGNGIRGQNNSSANAAIFGLNLGSGPSIMGQGTSNTGVAGNSTSGSGVNGASTSGSGIYGDSNTGYGVRGHSSSASGVYGEGAQGVYGNSTTGTGVRGESNSSFGGSFSSNSYVGLQGSSSVNTGVRGQSNTGDGVFGQSNSNIGVHGVGGTNGVYGVTGDGNGVYGSANASTGGNGMYAESFGTGSNGVYAESHGSNGNGVLGVANNGLNAYGIWGRSITGYAGFFSGNVHVTGSCCAASIEYMQIDHPLDPANKYLNMAAVASADMLDIQSGNVTTDAKGEATIILPDYFEALNRDFRYQMTVMGQFAQVIVSNKIKDNKFTIKTDKPNVEVSWQVTGVRHDPYAEQHSLTVEQTKPSNERGFYLHPELYGQPNSKQLDNARPASQATPAATLAGHK